MLTLSFLAFSYEPIYYFYYSLELGDPHAKEYKMTQEDIQDLEEAMQEQAEKEKKYFEEMDAKIQETRKVFHTGYPENSHVQELAEYAYTLGGEDFLLTLEGENGRWEWDRKSELVGKNDYRDYGLCQLNGQYHGKFIFANGRNRDSGYSQDFKNPKRQIEYCFEVWQDAVKKNRLPTTFYAYNIRHKRKNRFIFNY